MSNTLVSDGNLTLKTKNNLFKGMLLSQNSTTAFTVHETILNLFHPTTVTQYKAKRENRVSKRKVIAVS